MSRVREQKGIIKTMSYSKFMLNCFAMIVTRTENEKKFLKSRKQVTKYSLEFQSINTSQTLHPGVNS